MCRTIDRAEAIRGRESVILVSPALGKGSSYRSMGKVLPVPNRY